MDLDLTRPEYHLLSEKFNAAQLALAEFQLVFRAACAARDLQHAEFVSMTPHTMTVRVPDIPKVEAA